MKRWFLAPLLLLLLAAPTRSWAWGKQGHEMVAQIAFHFLDPAVRQKVLKALDGFSIEEAATWMDDARANHSFDAMRPWHYIDIEKGKDYQPAADKNALTILNGVIGKLQQQASFTGNAQRDLLLLFHLVGDIHQPLHTGYPADKGGNSINVDYDNSQVNLHSLWDTRLIIDEKITVADCLNLYATWPPERAEAVRNTGLMGWMTESRALLPQVYAFSEGRIDKSYCAQNKALVEQQLLSAGLRLARVLERSFGTGA
ncbi:MAG: hypothetical protein EOO16_22085 [Chitinophagaceae bacterium]|nr:MAG: hypothetical protein EOO16_22085 [Chitinophagaceae bacterium]